MRRGFAEAEKIFNKYAEIQAVQETGQIDRSGSCAVVALIVGDMCYVGNIGDSRAILSADGGEKILRLSKDHKPEDEEEKNRIERNGGKIYQNSSYIPDGQGGM
jgi:protein phosphatase PTC2/3